VQGCEPRALRGEYEFKLSLQSSNPPLPRFAHSAFVVKGEPLLTGDKDGLLRWDELLAIARRLYLPVPR
jgi:hypothetical protein